MPDRGQNEASAYETLDEAVRKALDSFFGWEACELAAQTDSEEVGDAESLWRVVLEDMNELSRVQRTLRGLSGARPLDVAIKHPARIAVERIPDYQAMGDNIGLNFYGSDGSRILVILSWEQANSLVGVGSTDPAEQARDLYVRGHIEVDEYERRLDRIGSVGASGHLTPRGQSVTSKENE